MKKKIAFVNQRYGVEITGGSETHTRSLAERLLPYYDVEILTTCALEYTTWNNHFPEGVQYVNEVPVRRFKVSKPRDMDYFNRISDRLFVDHLGEENKWIDAQGPLCKKLIKYIFKHKEQYDIYIFVTYLYYSTVRGISLVKNKSILIPTAHDELPIYLSIYQQVFNSPQAIAYNTEEERDLVYSIFHNEHIPSDILGVGIDLPETICSETFKTKYQLSDYLVYAGRICEGKGCSKLFEFFIQYKKDNPSNLKLILMGKTDMPVPRHPDIAALGFVSEEDKYDGMAGAKMLVLPSQYESLSIVVLESLALGVPVVVNGNCEVLRGHCRKSNAGLYYQTYREFEGILNYLLSHTDAYTAMRENGKKYVAKNYNWDKIINKLCSMIENITEQDIGVNPNNYANHGRRPSCT